ncbi:hypothetical protein BJY52DRAFT_1096883, partial [Lactarius psammicola]
PVGPIHKYLKRRTRNNVRIGARAAIHTSAILEYLTAEVLRLVGASRAHASLFLALTLLVRGDGELETLVQATIARGGILPL